MKNEIVDVVIPIYKEKPDEDDVLSIRQAFKILERYPITFVCPQNLDTKNYQNFGEAVFETFDDKYFKSIYGYNQLMLSVDFYKRFAREYILIYQTDAYIFKDNLEFWCGKDYDYIGAPWIRSQEHIPLIKKIWDSTICWLKALINYRGNQKTQKDKSLLYNEVGNGGLSLRKRESFIKILSALSKQVEIYLKPINKSAFYAEDVFFSIEPKRNNIEFKKPNYKEACLFAIENKIEKALTYNNGLLPMGCHRWNKENKLYWKQFIKDEA